jgi:lipopolysaccharide export system protein LptA
MRKRIFLLFLLVLLCLSAICSAKPVVNADSQYFDPSTGLYVLSGNVDIEVGSRTITAGKAKVDMSSMQVWGSGGITVTQDDINFTGDSVYVYGTSSYAKITGGVKFQRGGLIISADQAEYNWKTKDAVFSGNVTISQPDGTKTASMVKYNIDAASITDSSE